MKQFKELEVGGEYFTYYFGTTSKGDKISDYTGIIKVKVIDKRPCRYGKYEDEFKFEVVEGRLSYTMSHNIHGHLQGYARTVDGFFDDKDEAISCHDAALIRLSKEITNITSSERVLKKVKCKATRDKLIKPKKTLESEALAWRKGLSDKEYKYLEFFEDNVQLK